MLNWIYETISENAWVLVITSLCFLLSKFYFRVRFKEIQGQTKETSQTNEFDKCRSASCVRCRTSKEILTRAKTRLSYQAFPMQGNKKDGNNILHQIYLDLENSLHKRFMRFEGVDQNPSVFRMSGLDTKPWWELDDIEEFRMGSFSDDVLNDIRSEFFSLMQKSDTESSVKSMWKMNTTPNGMWSICHLMDQGRITKAKELCPNTWKSVEGVHSLLQNNVFGNVAFSVIVPGTNITTHYGPTNMRLRMHIDLMIPDGCVMVVNGEERSYQEGQVLLFDDSFAHSVLHHGKREDGVRAVLLIDIWHPQVDDELRHVLNYCFSSEI